MTQEPLERQREPGALLTHALLLYRESFLAFAAIAAAIVVPAQLIVSGIGLQELTSRYDATPPRGDLIVSTLVSYLVITPLVTAICVYALRSIEEGRGARPGAAITRGLEAFGPIFLAVLAAAAGIAVGLVLLVLPGIYLAVRLYFVPQAVVLAGKRRSEALIHSWELVEGRWWRTFGIVLLVNVVALLPGFLIQAPFAAVAKSADTQAVALGGLIVVQTLTAPFVAIAAILMFFDLRAGRPPPTA